MWSLIENVAVAVGQYIPHEMFSVFGPRAGALSVVLHLTLLYIYLMTALWLVFRRALGGSLSRDALVFSAFGLAFSLSGPAVAVALRAGVLPSAWEGAWHVGVLVPLFMALSRFLAGGDGEADPAAEPAPEALNATDRDKLVIMLSETSDGVITVSRGGRVEMVNRAAEKLLGLRPVDVAGQPLSALAEKVKLYTPDQKLLPAELWPASRALREGTIANELDVQMFPSKGKRLFLKVSASPLRNSRGQIDTVICVFKDRTAHHQLEMLKEELFSRPPALDDAPAAPAQTQQAAAATAAPSAPAETPASAGQETVPTASFLKSFLWEQSGEATRMGITFLDQIPSTLPAVRGSAAGMKKAMASLLQYAMNATAAGGMVRVMAAAQGDNVLIAIRDGGMGMIPDEVTRFSDQLDGLSSTKGDQTRNPLYPLIVAKEQLAASGLALHVRSEGLKKGTEYYFLAPIAGASSSVVWDNETTRRLRQDQ